MKQAQMIYYQKFAKLGLKEYKHFEVLFNRRHDTQHNDIQHKGLLYNTQHK
jgi:hypothetical protein